MTKKTPFKWIKVRARPEVRDLLEKIAEAKAWSLTAVVERAIEDMGSMCSTKPRRKK